jgi:hypothetical protein
MVTTGATSVERIEQLIEACKTATRLEAEGDGLDVMQTYLADVQGKAAEFEKRAATVIAELDQERRTHREAVNLAHKAVTLRQQAAAKLDEHKHQHWKLFDVENPAEAGKKRHLVRAAFGPTGSTTYSVVELEQVMSNPAGMAIAFSDPKAFVPVHQQSAEELAELITTAMGLIRSGRQGRYLIPSADDGKVIACRNVVYTLEWGMGGDKNMTIDRYTWVRAPWQTGAEFVALQTNLAKLIAKQQKKDPETFPAPIKYTGR